MNISWLTWAFASLLPRAIFVRVVSLRMRRPFPLRVTHWALDCELSLCCRSCRLLSEAVEARELPTLRYNSGCHNEA
jgi:hypothetical protein